VVSLAALTLVCVCVDYDGDVRDLMARWAKAVDVRLRELSAE
jgi:hypothetical protein